MPSFDKLLGLIFNADDPLIKLHGLRARNLVNLDEIRNALHKTRALGPDLIRKVSLNPSLDQMTQIVNREIIPENRLESNGTHFSLWFVLPFVYGMV